MSEGAKAALIVGGVLGTMAIFILVLLLLVPLLIGAALFSQMDGFFAEYDPKAISAGKAFHWNDSEYAAGWRLSGETGEQLRPMGLTFQSSDLAVDSGPETYSISFVRDGVVVTQASCETEEPIKSGTANKLECAPSFDGVGEYDEIVIGYPEDLVTGDAWDEGSVDEEA